MTFTPEQKQHAIELIESGEKLQAVKYLRESLDISLEDALALAEKLEEEVEIAPIGIQFNEQRIEKIQQSGKKVGRLIGLIFGSIGLIMLAVASWLIVSNQQFEQRAVPVKGKVVDYSSYESSDDDGGYTTMYSPIFEYEYKGQTYTHTSSTGSSSQEYSIDEAVEILVDPDNPYEVLVNNFYEKWLLPLILGGMGLIFSGMGFLAFWIFGKQK